MRKKIYYKQTSCRMLSVMMAVLSLSLFAASCTDNAVSVAPIDKNARELKLQVTIPNGMPVTKAGTGDVSSVDPESMIYSLQIWMFNHQAAGASTRDGETAVAYAEIAFANGKAINDANLTDGSGYYSEEVWDGTPKTIYEIPMYIPGYVMDRPVDDMKFDFYVLANGSSIGSTLSRTSKRGEFKTAVFGYESETSDWFGPTQPKVGSTPSLAINGGSGTGPGLPISGFFNRTRNAQGKAGDPNGVDLSFLKTNTTVAAAQQRELSPVVQLTRAVSKLRFVFAKPQDMTGVTVTSIEVNGEMIPANTFVFPREDGSEFALPGAVSYLNNVTSVGSLTSDDIMEVTDPERLSSNSEVVSEGQSKAPKDMTAQEYDDFLSTTIGEKTSTQRLAYLRESAKPISCKINYKISAAAAEQSVSFSMPEATGYTADNTNFHRNHSWTVYAYFMGDGLYIKPVVLDWEDGSNYTYTQRGSAVVAISTDKQTLFGYGWTTSNNNDWWQAHKDDVPEAATEWYFRRQDEDYTGAWSYDWLHSQMVSAPGLNAGGVPIYANRIELRTNGFNVPLRLKLSDSEDFYIVTYNSARAEYVRWIEGSDQMEAGWTEADGALIPQSVTAGGTTYFYVVPKDGADHVGKKTEAYLVTAPTDGSGSQKIPFNAGLFPGSNENTEINFYSVDVDTFKSYYNSASRPVNIKAYDKSGEVTI